MKTTYRYASLLLLLALLAGCGQTTDGINWEPRLDAPELEKVEAQRRRQTVDNLEYQLAIDLSQGDERFSGQVQINLNYQPGAFPLTVDFTRGTIQSLEINGVAVEADYNEHFLSIPSQSLREGSNVLNIAFSQAYSQDGQGLYRYVDPEDQRVYLYSDFEPYAANRLFPHFDQPDLKARFGLEVLAPASWQVISTTRESSIEPEEGARRWYFPQTLPMSSYYFSLHAGEYHLWEGPEFRYPLRLFIRHSMAAYVDPSIWFDYTRNGFNFFEPWFDYDYPFKKYDQLIVPDYNVGAMENAAAVTFSERYVSRGAYTREDRHSIAGVIFHEMAHMWFGDLATMAWWDGLWLNESFASLMANIALANEPEFPDSWHSFFLGYKQWAYAEDQLVTTHPIQLPVKDTDTAETIFDGISYGKGSAVLKQLSKLIGQAEFQKGVQRYMKKNAFGNTELQDFTDAAGQAAGRDLTTWSANWLDTAGVNRLDVELSCEAGLISELTLNQSATPEYPVLRTHAISVALFQVSEQNLTLTQVFDIEISGQTSAVEQARGAPCPDLVYPNYNDWGYLQVNLDDNSLETVRQHINNLQVPLQRSMLWQDLWSMVTTTQLGLQDFLDIAHHNINGETDELVLRGILRSVGNAFYYYHLLGGNEAALASNGERFESLLWDQLQRSHGDVQRQYLNSYIATANTSKAFSRLIEALGSDRGPADMELDQDLRWDMIAKLQQFQHPAGTQLLAKEREHDASAKGQQLALKADVLGSAASEKHRWREKALRRGQDYRLVNSRIILNNLYPVNQRYQLQAVAAEALARLPALQAEQDILLLRYTAGALVPRVCTAKNYAALSKVVESGRSFTPSVEKALRVARQLEQRCLAMRAYNAQL
jgi:aminopeptidase N